MSRTFKVSNIKVAGDKHEVKVPIDLQPVKEWLEEYKMDEYAESDELAKYAYIRTAMFYMFHIDFDIEEITASNVLAYAGFEEQVYCVDAIDHTYDKYEITEIEILHPTDFYLFFDHEPEYAFGSDDFHTTVFGLLMQYLPVNFIIK